MHEIDTQKRRLALIGTGFRGTSMWGVNVVKGYGDHVEIVGLCDTNWMRADRARLPIGRSRKSPEQQSARTS